MQAALRSELAAAFARDAQQDLATLQTAVPAAVAESRALASHVDQLLRPHVADTCVVEFCDFGAPKPHVIALGAIMALSRACTSIK